MYIYKYNKLGFYYNRSNKTTNLNPSPILQSKTSINIQIKYKINVR